MSVSNCGTRVQRGGGCFRSIPARYVLCAMCFTALALEYVLKIALSVTIVAMVQHGTANSTDAPEVQAFTRTTEEELDVCPGKIENEAINNGGEFDWDEELQGYVLSAISYGSVVTNLIAGRLSEMFGPKYVLGPGVLIAGILSLLSPVAARLHVGAFIAVRVLVGASSGALMPAINVILANWYSKEERTSIAGVIMAAIPVGTILGLSLSGVLANLYGWSIVYYIFGGISVFWFIPYIFLVYNTPEDHPRISDEEKTKILCSTGPQKRDKVSLAVPWFSILTSLPLWAHVTMSVGYAWLGSTLLSELPTYLSTILHFDLQKSGIISALPFIFATISGMFFAFLSQWLRRKGYISQITAYRIFNTISGVISLIFLFVITMVGCNSDVIIILLILSMMSLGAYAGGSLVNNLDLASNFAGTTSGISSTLSSITAIFTPLVVGALTNGQQTLTQWHIVFYISISVMLASYFVYMIFGSAEEQPWNNPPTQHEESQDSNITYSKEEDV